MIRTLASAELEAARLYSLYQYRAYRFQPRSSVIRTLHSAKIAWQAGTNEAGRRAVENRNEDRQNVTEDGKEYPARAGPSSELDAGATGQYGHSGDSEVRHRYIESRKDGLDDGRNRTETAEPSVTERSLAGASHAELSHAELRQAELSQAGPAGPSQVEPSHPEASHSGPGPGGPRPTETGHVEPNEAGPSQAGHRSAGPSRARPTDAGPSPAGADGGPPSPAASDSSSSSGSAGPVLVIVTDEEVDVVGGEGVTSADLAGGDDVTSSGAGMSHHPSGVLVAAADSTAVSADFEW